MFVRKETLVRDLQGFARWLVAPQLMGRAVRRNANTNEGVIVNSARIDCHIVSVLTILLLGIADTMAVAQSSDTFEWAAGIRAEFVGMGGSQLADQKDGVGLNLFVNRRLIHELALEIGLSVSFHKDTILVVGGGFRTYMDPIATLYAGPIFRFPLNSGAAIPHVGAQIGITGADFSDASFAIQGGLSGGVLVPISQRLELSVSATGRVMRVIPYRLRYNPYPIQGAEVWGRQIVLSSGLVLKLGKS